MLEKVVMDGMAAREVTSELTNHLNMCWREAVLWSTAALLSSDYRSVLLIVNMINDSDWLIVDRSTCQLMEGPVKDTKLPNLCVNIYCRLWRKEL